MQKFLKHALAGAMAIVCSVAVAQVNLGTDNDVAGQLRVKNAQPLLNALPQMAPPSGRQRGIQAQDGFAEQFAPDVRCLAGTANAIGFDVSTGADCSVPGFYHGTSYDLERTLAYGVTNALPPAFDHFSLTFSDSWGGANSTNVAYVGMSTCARGQYNCGAANELGIVANGSGVFLQDAGQSIPLWKTTVTTNAYTIGSDDSGLGVDPATGNRIAASWAPPESNVYGFSLVVPGDGTAIVSVMPTGGTLCLSNSCSYVARVKISLPPGSFHQFFVRGGAADYISDVSYAGGHTLYSTHLLPVYDLPHNPNVHVGRMLRFALHADGSEWNYTTPANDIDSFFVVIPPDYNPATANPWYLQLMGQEYSTVSFFGTMHNVVTALYDAGMVGVYTDFHNGNHYGSPQDMLDVASLTRVLRNTMALTNQPHLLADSAGGIVAVNAIARGILKPRSLQCYSCNISLAWDVANGQMPYIQTSYKFSDPLQFGVVTAGYDSLNLVQHPNATFTPLASAYPLLPNAARVLAVTPTYVVTPAQDDTVDRYQNGIPFYNALVQMNPTPGFHALWSDAPGGHVGQAQMIGQTALDWVNSHP